MTQKKLEIIGPYTPDHEGPYALAITRNPKKCVVHSVVDKVAFITAIGLADPFICSVDYIMNAEEIPEAREFWINECRRGDGSIGNTYPHETECEAMRERQELPHWNWVRTIHVREVLPGDE